MIDHRSCRSASCGKSSGFAQGMPGPNQGIVGEALGSPVALEQAFALRIVAVIRMSPACDDLLRAATTTRYCIDSDPASPFILSTAA